MRAFFLASLAYFAASLVIVAFVRGPDWDVLSNAPLPSMFLADLFIGRGLYLGILALALIVLLGFERIMKRLPDVMFGCLGFAFTFAAFLIVKPAMPLIIPFWADPVLADIDRALHFGHDPWRFAAVAGEWLGGSDNWAAFYTTGWVMYAAGWPAILALIDDDKSRLMRHVWLYFLTWIILGNVVALAFMSGGPIFYQQIVGTDRFADMKMMIVDSGLAASSIGSAQAFLWESYVESQQELGAGISAFPSLHVAAAMLPVLYFMERHRLLAVIAGVNLALVLWFSVVSGYHYAIDGYASIILTYALYLVMNWASHRQASRNTARVLPAE